MTVRDFRRLQGNVTVGALIKAMQAWPYRGISIEPKRQPMPVRDLSL